MNLAADPFADPLIKHVQELHDKGVQGDKEAVNTVIIELEKLVPQSPNNKLLQAYLGSAYTLRSRDLFPGPSKLKFLQLGLKTMDDAVGAAPGDIPVRFIRAINNFQLPSFFNRRDTARNDFEVLLTSLSQPEISENYSVDTVQAVYYYAGLAYKQRSDTQTARRVWNDGIKLAPSSALGEKISGELNKLKS